MTQSFVAAVLESFEGTLDAVLDQIDEGEFRREIKSLREYIAQRRRKFEKREVPEPAGAGLTPQGPTGS